MEGSFSCCWSAHTDPLLSASSSSARPAYPHQQPDLEADLLGLSLDTPHSTTTIVGPATPSSSQPSHPASSAAATGRPSASSSTGDRPDAVPRRAGTSTSDGHAQQQGPPSSSSSPLSEPLPPGWEAKVDRTSNRIFYVDHNNKVLVCVCAHAHASKMLVRVQGRCSLVLQPVRCSRTHYDRGSTRSE